MRREPVEHPLDQRRSDQRAGAVVDQHPLGRRRAQALEPDAHQFLAARAALGRCQKVEALGCRLVELAVRGMDHRAHRADPRMAPEALEAVAQHRLAGERLVLLGPRPAEPLAASRGDDQGHAVGQGGRSFRPGVRVLFRGL